MAYADVIVADGATCYLKLDETSGTTADDAVGSDDHTYQSSPTLGAAGLVSDANTAVTLNGSSQYISQASPSANLNLGDKFTVELWLKRGRSGQQEDLWGRNYGGGQIVRFTSDDKITLRKSGVANIVQATATITDTATHHVVVTKNGSTVKIYIDGSDVTGTVTNQTFGSVSGASVIGRDAAGSSGYFQGTLDEVAFYKNVELTSTQVASHYELGANAPITRSASIAATTSISTRPAVATVTPARAVGVCVHPGWTDKYYNNYYECFSDIDELGTKLIRGGGSGDGNITQWLSNCQSRGVKMIYGPPSTIAGITTAWLNTVESQMTAYPGVICAIEGLNEPDLNTYPEQEPGESPVEYALRHQTALYNAVHPRFPTLPILAPSIAGNYGWTEALANDVSGYCTVANCHYYTSGGTAAVSLSAVNTAFANARAYAGVEELWVTETGIRSPVTGCTDQEGADRLVGILDAMRLNADTPATRVCVYQLESVDDYWADQNDWALYWQGFTPKLKATALKDYIANASLGATTFGSLAATTSISATGTVSAGMTRTASISATASISTTGTVESPPPPLDPPSLRVGELVPDGAVIDVYEMRTLVSDTRAAPGGEPVESATVVDGSVTLHQLMEDHDYFLTTRVAGNPRRIGLLVNQVPGRQ